MPAPKPDPLSYANINTIIWDWNGTLLDDVDICVASIGQMIEKRHLPPLSKEKYRDIFTFPVKDYYEVAGFDLTKEVWDEVAMEFMGLYFSKLPGCSLHDGTKEILFYFHQKGYKQAVLSAMEHQALMNALDHFGILSHFKFVAGIKDHFASSKSEQARQLLQKLEVDPGHVIMAGDSLHDHEVASQLNCRCILIAQGHQSRARLLKTNCVVVDHLQDLQKFL